MDIDFWELFKFAWVLVTGVALYFWKGHVARIEKLEKRVADQERGIKSDVDERFRERDRSLGRFRDQLGEIKAAVDHAPSKDDVHELALKVADQNTSLANLNATLGAIQPSVARIEDWLLKSSGEK